MDLGVPPKKNPSRTPRCCLKLPTRSNGFFIINETSPLLFSSKPNNQSPLLLHRKHTFQPCRLPNSSDASQAHFQSEAPTETFRMSVNQSGPLPAHFRVQSAQSNLPSTTAAHEDDYMQAVCAERTYGLSILQAQATSSSQAFMQQHCPSISRKQPSMQHQIDIGYHPCWNADDLSWLMTFSRSESVSCGGYV